MPRPYSAPGAGWAAACSLRRALAPTWCASPLDGAPGAVRLGSAAAFRVTAPAAAGGESGMSRLADIGISAAAVWSGAARLADLAGWAGIAGSSTAHLRQPAQHDRLQLGQ